jgi:hypothetical protein
MKQYLIRLDRVAGELNLWLLAIAIGLAMLDFSIMVTKCLPPITPPPASLGAEPSAETIVQPPSSTIRSTRG